MIRIKDRIVRTKEEAVKLHIEDLNHVFRFLKGTLHEDDCPAAAQRFNMCECGKVLAIEQVQSALNYFKGASLNSINKRKGAQI